MATKKFAPQSKGAKTTKAAIPAKASSKTATSTKTTKPASTKVNTKPSTNTAKPSAKSKPQKHTSRIIATIIGVVAAVALVIITIVCLANNINKNGKNSLTVIDGDGKKVATEYLGFDDYSFRLKIPTSFKAMTSEEIEKKYGKDGAPKIVYTNDANDVNIAVSPTDSTITNDQIETYLNTMKSVLSVGGEIINTELFTQGSHNVGTIQITTDSDDTKYYNEMLFFSQDDKLNMVSFNCKEDQRKKWQPVGEFIMKSIDFTK